MIRKTIVSLFALISSAQNVNPNGIKGSLDIAVIQQAKDVYMDTLLDVLNNLVIPDVGDDKDYLHGNHVSVQQNAQDVTFTSDVENNAIMLTANNLSANFYTDSFRGHSWIFVAKGNARVEMKTVNIGLGLSFETQTLESGRVVPAVKAVDVLVDINHEDISIHISGNIWADFASAFEIFFKSTVVSLIQDTVRDTLTDSVPIYINGVLAKSNASWSVAGFDNWELDWMTAFPAIVTDTSIECGFRGIMYDTQVGESEWSIAFPDMPYNNPEQPSKFQLYLADLSVGSLLGSYTEVGDIAGWVHGDDIPSTNKTLTAGELDLAFSGFSKKYGKDAIVDIHFNVTALHDFTSSSATQDVTVFGTTNLQFWPRFNDTTELAVEIDLVDIKFTAGIKVDGYNATGETSDFHVDKINIVNSTIGNISAFKLKLEFNTASKVIVPAINTILQRYVVPIPQNILGVFNLSNIYLTYNDGYIQGGATPTFIPPTPSELLESLSFVF